MLVLTTAFFVAELTVGYMCNSLALVADSFHMLSDSFALVIGLVSIRLAKRKKSEEFTFGWVRAEVVGALHGARWVWGSVLSLLGKRSDLDATPADTPGLHGSITVLYIPNLTVSTCP
jgi:zinc transporter 1